MVCSNRDEERLAEDLASLSGSLIEIYVFDADRAAWKQAVDVLSRHAAMLEIVVEGRHIAVDQFDEIPFDDSARVLRADIRGAEWTSTLHSEDQVDLQADPDDFREPGALAQLLDLLRQIADATQRSAVLIPESVRPRSQTPLASARPGTRRW